MVSLADVAPLSEQTCPQLHPNNAKDKEYEKAEQQHIAQHRQGVKEQHHKDSHAYNKVHSQIYLIQNIIIIVCRNVYAIIVTYLLASVWHGWKLLPNHVALLTWNSVYSSQGPQHPHSSYGRKVQFLNIQAIFQGAEKRTFNGS